MASQPTTAEISVSKAKDVIIREAKRIEEALLYSSRGHFTAARLWSNFHLWIGIPMVLLSAIAGASALAEFDHNHVIAGILSIIIAALSGVMTFLNPNAKAAAHQTAGNKYDSLMNKVRMFWSIDCWRDESDDVLTEKVKYLSEQKDVLNNTCPQPPNWAYKIAKRGIAAGEADYEVDKEGNDRKT
jgi:SMODS and SLOG-associating 2TM effector domain family 4